MYLHSPYVVMANILCSNSNIHREGQLQGKYVGLKNKNSKMISLQVLTTFHPMTAPKHGVSIFMVTQLTKQQNISQIGYRICSHNTEITSEETT
jgi:hypothetical protein